MTHAPQGKIGLNRPSFWALALLLGVSACGQRNEQDLEQISPTSQNSDAVGETGGFVVSGKATENPSNGTSNNPACVVDLEQDVVINPKGGTIRAIFSGKQEKQHECRKDFKSEVLYISSPTEFSIDPGYACKVSKGEFNVRCNGKLVRYTDAGLFQLTIAGDGQFDSTKIRMRIVFEAKAK